MLPADCSSQSCRWSWPRAPAGWGLKWCRLGSPAPTPNPSQLGGWRLVVRCAVRDAGVWPTESSLGGDSLMGGHGPRRPPRCSGSFGLGRAGARFPKRCWSALPRRTEPASTGRWSAAASIRPWWPLNGAASSQAARFLGSTRILGPDSARSAACRTVLPRVWPFQRRHGLMAAGGSFSPV